MIHSARCTLIQLSMICAAMMAMIWIPTLTRAEDAAARQPGPSTAATAGDAGAADLTSAPATADASASAEPSPIAQPAVSSEQIQTWIKDLDSNKFAEREAASQHLAKAGPAAVEGVAKATGSKSREVSMRAMELLGKWLQSPDKVAQQKARAVLAKLAKADDASLARQAEKLLTPPVDPTAPQLTNQFGQPIIVGPFNPQAPGGGLQIIGGNMRINAGVARQVSIKNVNGQRTVDAKEGDRSVHIEDDPQKGIAIKVTDKVAGGPDKVAQYTAKNLDDLKQNQPEGYKVHQKYLAGGPGAMGGVIQFQIQAQALGQPNFNIVPIPPGAVPAPPIPGGQSKLEPAPAAPAPSNEKPADEKPADQKQAEPAPPADGK